MFFKRYISKDVTADAITSAYRHTPSTDEDMRMKGEINALISVSGDGSFQADRAVKFVWDGILDGYLFSASNSTIENVKRAMEAGAKKLVELMKNDKELEEKGINLSFAVGVFKDKTAYLGLFGEEDIYVYKNGDFVNLSEILSENKGTVASIALEDEDLVLMSSPLLLSSFAKVVEPGTDPSEMMKRLDMFSDEMTGNQGVLFLSRKEYEIPIVEDIEELSVEAVSEEEPAGKSLPENTLEQEGKKSPLDKTINNETKEKIEKIRASIASFFDLAQKKLEPVFEWLSGLFGKIWERIKRVLDNQYGRKIWYKKLMSRFTSLRLTDGQSAYGMKIDGYKDKNLRNKRFASMGMIILAVVVVLVGARLSINARQARQLHQEAGEVFEVAEGYLNEAEQKILSDRSGAETAVFQADQELDTLEGKDLSIDDAKTFKDLRSRQENLDNRINKKVAVSEEEGNMENFINTRLAFGESSNASDLIIYKDEFQNEYLYVADKGLGAVYRVATFDKTSIKLPDSNKVLVSPEFIDVGVEGIYVYDDSSGVVKSPFGTGGNSEDFVGLVGLGIEDLGADSVSELAIFTQVDNVYLLSQSENAVLKSNRTGSGGYGLPFTYISSQSFGTSSDLFGDISIYVLTAGTNGLERYVFNSQSAEATSLPLTISGLSPEFENLTAGYTGASLDNGMYVFDASQRRLIVFEKPKETVGEELHPNEMVLVNQYYYSGDRKDVFKDVKDIVVDSNEDYAYVLDGNTVWRIELD